MKKKIIEDAVAICDKIVDAIIQRNNGRQNCHTYCPGENALIGVLNSGTSFKQMGGAM